MAPENKHPMPQRRLAAIMFADIVGYTAMMQQDETDGFIRLERYREILEEKVAAYQGEILNHYGDGSLSVFASTVNAITCAKEIQESLKLPPEVPLRIGIHRGEVVSEGKYIYGDDVNVASRIESLAAPGSVLLTQQVKYELQKFPEYKTLSLGDFSFKNVKEPMEVFALDLKGLSVPTREGIKKTSRVAKAFEAPRSKVSQAISWIVFLLSVIIVGGYLVNTFWLHTKSVGKSIAVLPFKDLSPSGGQGYFSDGISEEILNALTQIKDLKVVGRTSSFSFRGKDDSFQEIGEQLGVGTILEGSVQKAGERVRVIAKLINTKDGSQIWSERYNRELNDIFAIQEDVARAVATNLKSILLADEETKMVKILTENQAAYELYLRGKYMLSQRTDGVEKATEFFERAIELDPKFAAAYAGLGHAYLWLAWGYYLPSHNAFPQAQFYAKEALRLDSTMTYAHYLLGSVNLWYNWEWQLAKQSLEIALALNPSESAANLDLGWYYTIIGQPNKAFAQVEQAIARDHLNLEYNVDLAEMYRMARQYDKALEVGQSMRQIYPDNSDTHWAIGMAYYNKGDFSQAVTSFREAVRLSNEESWALVHLAFALGKIPNSQKEIQTIMSQLDEDTTVEETLPVELAMMYLSLGDQQKALDLLEGAFEIRANWLVSLKVDPVWDALRGKARFKALVEKMDFPD